MLSLGLLSGLQPWCDSAFFKPVCDVQFPECVNILYAGGSLNCDGAEIKGQTKSEASVFVHICW